MKTAFVIALGATLISAQNFNGIPACAVPCLQTFVPQAGCAIEDTACQCKPDKQAALGPLITPCLLANCSSEDLQTTLSASGAICAALASSAVSSALTPSTTMPPMSSSTGGGMPSTTPNAAPAAGAAGPVVGVVAAVLGFAAFL